MVNKIKNLIFADLQVVVPGFKNFNKDQKLIIVSFVPSFSQNGFLKKIGYKMPLA